MPCGTQKPFLKCAGVTERQRLFMINPPKGSAPGGENRHPYDYIVADMVLHHYVKDENVYRGVVA
jgi:hypothetical protein